MIGLLLKNGRILKMSHTFTSLIYHVAFSTAELRPLIKEETESELYAYLGGLVKELKGKPIKINGIEDHVHMLFSIPPTVSVSDAMRVIKTNSSKWMNEKFGKPFKWQKGFGAFSVSRSGVDAVVKYIENQKEHHRKYDFRAEFLLLLDKSEVECDEEYLWK